MTEKKIKGYKDEGYKQKENLYDSIAQAFTNLKAEKSANSSFIAVENLKGVTLKLINNTLLSLTYHRIEMGTTDSLARNSDEGKNFIKEIEKELKKSFKKLTKKALKLKKEKEDQVTDKYSHVQSDTSWMVGSSRYGHASQMGRYLVRDTIIYSFDEETLA